jgi:hypothetical protein
MLPEKRGSPRTGRKKRGGGGGFNGTLEQLELLIGKENARKAVDFFEGMNIYFPKSIGLNEPRERIYAGLRQGRPAGRRPPSTDTPNRIYEKQSKKNTAKGDGNGQAGPVRHPPWRAGPL